MANKNPFDVLNIDNDSDDEIDVKLSDTCSEDNNQIVKNNEKCDIQLPTNSVNDYTTINDNLIQFNTITVDDNKDWTVISNKRPNKKRSHFTNQEKLVLDDQHNKKWFKDNTWAHHYLIGNICDNNKISFYAKDKKTKKLGELYQEVYDKHQSSNRKLYGYLVSLQESLEKEDLSIWKHKYYMGIYCDKNGVPLYEMDTYRKDKAMLYQKEHNN